MLPTLNKGHSHKIQSVWMVCNTDKSEDKGSVYKVETISNKTCHSLESKSNV